VHCAAARARIVSPGPSSYFTADEYRDRWCRVHQAMADRGYDTLIVWQRGAGTFDRWGMFIGSRIS